MGREKGKTSTSNQRTVDRGGRRIRRCGRTPAAKNNWQLEVDEWRLGITLCRQLEIDGGGAQIRSRALAHRCRVCHFLAFLLLRSLRMHLLIAGRDE